MVVVLVAVEVVLVTSALLCGSSGRNVSSNNSYMQRIVFVITVSDIRLLERAPLILPKGY